MRERPILFSAPMIRALIDGRKTQTRRVMKPQPAPNGTWSKTLNDFVCLIDEYPPSATIWNGGWLGMDAGEKQCCPCGVPGDRLWVRETWQHAPQDRCDCPQPSEPSPCDDWSNGTGCRSNRGEVLYRADVGNETEERSVVRLAHRHGTHVAPWRPSIHMPRWASRITLEITDIRVERLQEISEADAEAEGAAFTCPQCGNDLDDEHGTEVHAACDDPDMGSHGEGFRRIWTAINGSGSWDANPFVWCLSFRRIET